jgi:hypothetical protein
MRVAVVVEGVALLRPEAVVHVPAAAGQGRAPFGHEGRHDRQPLADLLHARLEEDPAVGRLQRVRGLDGGLQHTRAGFGVQSLDGDAEGGQLVHESGEEGPVVADADERVAEHARGERRRGDETLGMERLRRLLEVEPLELEARLGREPRGLGAGHDLLEQRARADGERRALAILEVGQEEGDVSVPGHVAQGGEVDAGHGIRVSGVPPRVGAVVVADVAGVPAEHDIAEPEAAAFRGREELVLVKVLAAQDAVDVGDGDLDLLPRRAAQLLEDVLVRAGGPAHFGAPGDSAPMHRA